MTHKFDQLARYLLYTRVALQKDERELEMLKDTQCKNEGSLVDIEAKIRSLTAALIEKENAINDWSIEYANLTRGKVRAVDMLDNIVPVDTPEGLVYHKLKTIVDVAFTQLFNATDGNQEEQWYDPYLKGFWHISRQDESQAAFAYIVNNEEFYYDLRRIVEMLKIKVEKTPADRDPPLQVQYNLLEWIDDLLEQMSTMGM